MVVSRAANACLILACVVSAPAFAQQYTISTYAGGAGIGLEVSLGGRRAGVPLRRAQYPIESGAQLSR